MLICASLGTRARFLSWRFSATSTYWIIESPVASTAGFAAWAGAAGTTQNGRDRRGGEGTPVHSGQRTRTAGPDTEPERTR